MLPRLQQDGRNRFILEFILALAHDTVQDSACEDTRVAEEENTHAHT